MSVTEVPAKIDQKSVAEPYELERQIGFVLRRAHQRATAIFNAHFKDANLSTVQFAALAKIRDEGRVSQNKLGRQISMDPTTIMGVVNRLVDRNLVRRLSDPTDRRRTQLTISSEGLRLLESCEGLGAAVTRETLKDLDPDERRQLQALLERIV